jgi:hypothetical protein
MKEQHAKETYYYGNFVDQLNPDKGWYTFDSRPRFGNNYVGLRNRFTILLEAYSYIDFRARIEVTVQFLHEILDAVTKHGRRMQKLADRADAQIARGKLRKLGVRFQIKPWRENVEILWERAVAAVGVAGTPDPWTEKGAIQRTGKIEAMKMTDYGIFAPTEKSDVPYAYLIDAAARDAIRVLLLHGIVVEKLARDTTLDAEQFVIKDVQHAESEFQGHHETTLAGKWKGRQETFSAGTYVVRMNQPLARLAFYLLEPRSDDGLVEWNVFDPHLESKVAPVRRITKATPIEAVVVHEVH